MAIVCFDPSPHELTCFKGIYGQPVAKRDSRWFQKIHAEEERFLTIVALELVTCDVRLMLGWWSEASKCTCFTRARFAFGSKEHLRVPMPASRLPESQRFQLRWQGILVSVTHIRNADRWQFDMRWELLQHLALENHGAVQLVALAKSFLHARQFQGVIKSRQKSSRVIKCHENSSGLPAMVFLFLWKSDESSTYDTSTCHILWISLSVWFSYPPCLV